MKHIKLFEHVTITDEMKEELDSLNHNITQSDIEELFIDFLDNESIKFSDFMKAYRVEENSYTINYDENENEIKRPATYLNGKVYITVKILDINKLDEYKKHRDWILTNDDIIKMIGWKYSIFNSTLRYNEQNQFWINKLEFNCCHVLWLKKFGKPTYGINRKYITSFFND